MSHVICCLKDIKLKRSEEFGLEVEKLFVPNSHNLSNKLPLMGRSGAGKSTLLNLMAAIEWPDNGTISWSFPDNRTIKWDENGLSAGDARKLRQDYFGYAFQDSTLMPHLRVCDNLCYPLMLKGYSARESKGIAANSLGKVLLEEEKVEDLFRRFPSKLSGGQRQRIALVQAMIHKPHVIFADEPTGSLDIETRKQVMNVLHEWADDPKHKDQRLLLWVTHHESDLNYDGVQMFLRINSGYCQWLESKKG